jgi:hypothetical protein
VTTGVTKPVFALQRVWLGGLLPTGDGPDALYGETVAKRNDV